MLKQLVPEATNFATLVTAKFSAIQVNDSTIAKRTLGSLKIIYPQSLTYASAVFINFFKQKFPFDISHD